MDVIRSVIASRLDAFEHPAPLGFQVVDGPAPGLCLVPGLVERADMRGAIVRPLARAVGVVDEAREAAHAISRRSAPPISIWIGTDARPLVMDARIGKGCALGY